MSSSSVIDNLVSQLIEATAGGRVKWADTADEDSFRTPFKAGSIRISAQASTDEDGVPDTDYYLVIINKDGKIADEYSSIEDDVKLGQLYELARRSARDSDAVINSILEELQR